MKTCMKNFTLFSLLLTLATGFAFAEVQTEFAHARDVRESGREMGIMLDLQKISLGTLPSTENKKQYLTTMMLEKQKVLNFTLQNIYENAYSMYKRGDYQRAYEMCITILSIDPNFKQAETLAKMASRMGTYGTTSETKIINQKYREGLMFYNTARLAEAKRSFQEVLVIKPRHAKANYWMKKTNKEIAKEYERRGNEAFKNENYEESITHWYNALLIREKDSRLVNKIAKSEKIIQKQKINDILTQAVQYYNEGDLVSSHKEFGKALAIQPEDKQILRLSKQVGEEVSKNYFATAENYYSSNHYTKAITNYEYALKWGFDKKIISGKVKQAKYERAELIKRRETIAKKEREKKFEEDLAAQKTATIEEATLEEELYEEEIEEIIVPIIVDEKKVSDVAREASQNLYKEGLRHFNDGDFEKAKEKFLEAVKVDSGNIDAQAGLERIKSVFGE